MAELADLIIKRQAQLEDLRLPWERLWQDIADYVVPVRANIKSESKGTNRATKIYDGSPLSAIELFAEGLFIGTRDLNGDLDPLFQPQHNALQRGFERAGAGNRADENLAGIGRSLLHKDG